MTGGLHGLQNKDVPGSIPQGLAHSEAEEVSDDTESKRLDNNNQT
jgi:hypothetical protein